MTEQEPGWLDRLREETGVPPRDQAGRALAARFLAELLDTPVDPDELSPQTIDGRGVLAWSTPDRPWLLLGVSGLGAERTARLHVHAPGTAVHVTVDRHEARSVQAARLAIVDAVDRFEQAATGGL
jgi:hypothetical protein